jgi:Zn-dependent protease
MPLCRTADQGRRWQDRRLTDKAGRRDRQAAAAAATTTAMDQSFNFIAFEISVWLLPILIAVTFHEAAHGFVARLLGDDTAWRLGRVSFNPLKHIDPFGTIVLPALLLLARSPFLFGYAKPVPVNFRALRHPRRDSILVAAAGPAMNVLLAILAAAAFHLLAYAPSFVVRFIAANLRNALVLNVVLAVFNLLPIPPLDGGRIVVSVLPSALGRPLSRLEPYGLVLLIGLLIVLPLFGAQFGLDLNFISQIITRSARAVIALILQLTGNT